MLKHYHKRSLRGPAWGPWAGPGRAGPGQKKTTAAGRGSMGGRIWAKNRGRGLSLPVRRPRAPNAPPPPRPAVAGECLSVLEGCAVHGRLEAPLGGFAALALWPKRRVWITVGLYRPSRANVKRFFQLGSGRAEGSERKAARGRARRWAAKSPAAETPQGSERIGSVRTKNSLYMGAISINSQA